MARIMKLLLFLKFSRKAFRKYLKHWSKDFVFSGRRDVAVHVLGNGPSLNDSLKLINKTDDVIMVNFAMLTDLFFELKPRYLCLADPILFEKTEDEDLEKKKKESIERLKQVDWGLTIVTPVGANTAHFQANSAYVSFACVNSVPLDYSIKSWRWSLYKRNFSMPSLRNVVVLGIFISLQKGYRTVYLHGVDSDSYKNICINQRNEMVLREFHYYGTSDRNMNEEKHHGFPTGSLYKRLKCEVTMFRSYVDLAGYADYLGLRVINASPNSMIDAFERYDHDEKLNG